MTNINSVQKENSLQNGVIDTKSRYDESINGTKDVKNSQREDLMPKDKGITFHHGMKFCESFDNNSVIYHGDQNDENNHRQNDATRKDHALETLNDSMAFSETSSPNDLNDDFNISSYANRLDNEEKLAPDPRTLPYHERKQVIEKYNNERQASQVQNDRKIDRIGLPTIVSRPSELSRPNAIQTRYGSSAPNLSHGGIPTPRNRTFSNDLDKLYDKGLNPTQKVLNRPSSIHVRNESSGSVSSLGSMTGGASTMTSRELNHLTEALNHDIHHYIDTSKGMKAQDNHRSGIFSNLLASVGGTSFDSNQSIEEMTDKFHKKNQKFLNKTERQRNRSRKNDIFRSLSPSVRSHSSHRPRLPSIDNDNWEDREQKRVEGHRYKKTRSRRETPPRHHKEMSKYGATESRKVRGRRSTRYLESQRRYAEEDDHNSNDDESCISSDFTSVLMEDGDSSSSSSSSSDRNSSYQNSKFMSGNHVSEYSSLLPSGEMTHEQGRGKPTLGPNRSNSGSMERQMKNNSIHRTRGRRHVGDVQKWDVGRSKKTRNIPLPPRKKNTYTDPFYRQSYLDEEDSSSSDGIDFEIDDYTKHLLKLQRDRLMMQWSKELELIKQEKFKRNLNDNQWHREVWTWFESIPSCFSGKISSCFSNIESFICNLPLTIGAIGLAVVTLGVVWFKFTEEMMNSCQPVHYHSKLCTFQEFPGCFECENTNAKWYKAALTFHHCCSAIAGIIALLFCLKIVLAPEVVRAEMNSPTTSSPAGLICMTIVCVFAGFGRLGEWVVILTATIHLIIAIWFLYMAQCYKSLPDPSWFPNTIGLGVSAVKTWLYFPIAGQLLMLVSIALFPFLFPFSLYRVFVNKKLSATVSWIQMSAPSVALYSLTIMAQPPFEEEQPDLTTFQRRHRLIYLPVMHFFFVCAEIGVLSSIHSLISRWNSFKRIPFSPAHAAFCFPALAHTNSVQAYRAALKSFSSMASDSTFRIGLDWYWFFMLGCSSMATVVITVKYLYMLPSWTKLDIEEDEDLPEPHETVTAQMILAGEVLGQEFHSAAVLQANETGALVHTRQGGKSKYVRTRKVTALGFDPIMTLMELNEERDALLNWVEKNPPRSRNRTLSVPGINGFVGSFGSNNTGIYSGGGSVPFPRTQRRGRAQTSDNHGFRYGSYFT